ncbi:MAG: hypothetical protein AB7F75_05390 [Planctomycetota bacterium]
MNKVLLILCIVLSLAGISGLTAKMVMSTLTKPAGAGAKGANLKSFESSVSDLEKLKGSELRQSIVATKAGQIEAYVSEIEALIQHFKARNDNLNAFFNGMEAKQPFTRPGGESITIPAPPEFSIRYLTEIQNLSTNFRGIFQVMGPDVNNMVHVSSSLPSQYAQKWIKDAPTAEDVLPAMREFNILSALYEVFRDGNIYSLDRIAVLTTSTGNAPGIKTPGGIPQGKTSNFYQPISIEIECRLAGPQIPELLSRILSNGRLIFQIREMKAEALSNDSKSEGAAAPEDPSKTSTPKPPKNGFKLQLTLHLLEFTLKKHEVDLQALKEKVVALKGGGSAE